MAIREGCWDCGSCGSVANRGRAVNCPRCGLPRPEGTRFYLPEDAPEVTDEAQLARARAGADWVCEHCAASASAQEADCPGCGAPRGASGTQEVHDYGPDEIPRDGGDRRAAARAAAALPAKRRSPWTGRGVLAAIAAMLWWFLAPHEVSAVVDAKSWNRTLEVQAYRTVRESDWAVPAGGREVRSYRAIREYRQVLDHYESRERQVSERVQTGTRTYTCGTRDLGNGHFEDRTCTEPEYETRYRTERYQEPIYRQEPVYATKHDYDIERWVRDTVLAAAGEADEPAEPADPAWPVTQLRERQREGERTEKYVLRFRDEDGDTYESPVALDQFQKLRVGAPVRIKVSRAGSVELLQE
ncbi:MAG: hypothetical protein AVDCRST_MAG68-679 [uncultured Gemmatimonadetes bacterium]|uniref:RanBP2-type domain-containing protein n=1 Tax=uncultured Gemmatimonadota bacterium TaxID=203437 RepID=A0A6J4KC94_9BACT|nr:MAG: hypothetical protein AVDCRST_MAG68-679 [uncultured Gemmatimonadota bacterium]